MRVALIDPSLFTLPYDAALAAGLSGVGHEVTLYGRAPGADDNDAASAPLSPIFYRLAGSRLFSRLPRPVRLGLKGLDHVGSMLRLRRRLANSRPQVIHFQWLPLPLIDRAFLAGLRALAPLVLTVHDTDPFNGNPASALQRLGGATALGQFARLIVHTEQGRERLVRQGQPPERVVVLPHGPLAATPAAVDGVADAMRGELTFLLFGKIKPYKGIDVLIEAFAALPPSLRAQARLRIVGKPYMELAPLQALATARGVADRVSFEPRFVADAEISALFGPNVIAAFPYREIEASGVLGFALANGRPVVASRLGNFAETVEDGVQGLLVPPGDAAALSAAMARLIADRDFAASCSRQARALAAAQPGWDEIARRTARLYAELAG